MTTSFPADPAGLPEAVRPELIELPDGGDFELRIAPVAKQLGEALVRMLAYNGAIPGPTLKVRQGSRIQVTVMNHGDLDATVHWHGVRLENRYDGVPYDTQPPVPVGGSFVYELRFPDPGLYWYHPHVREDYTQEMGLYGNVLVIPAEPGYWPPADQDVVLTLDDVLVEDGRIAPFDPSQTTHAAMGRFGNVLLTGGDVEPAVNANAGDVVRLWLTNTANARVFNLALPGARMKLIGGDSGRMEHAQLVTEVLLGPSERAVVDVLLGPPGQLALEHRTPRRSYHLATLTVTGSPAGRRSSAGEFDVLGEAPELIEEREGLDVWLHARPDKVLSIVAEMDVAEGSETGGPVSYTCPMDPEITSEQPGRCPKCGMKLMAVQPGDAAGHQMSKESGVAHHDRGADDPSTGGIEWEDDMAEVNRQTTPANTRWRFRDHADQEHGNEVAWRFTVGDRVKIRLQNEMESDHPMHHTFHLHGAGRFLVLARDGVTEPNLVWKDTVLLRTGETVDILLDVTNAGRWMAHCHIPEHMHSGMMFTFTVDE